MNDPQLSFSGNKLSFGNVNKKFSDEICEALVSPSGILVLFDWKNLGNRNVFLLDKNLDEIWQIKELDIDVPFRPFTGISLIDGKFHAYNGSGWSCEIDFAAGEARRVRFIK